MKKTVVTSALPYANGPIHLGHLVEYIQTDIYVRFLRSSGSPVIYVCADDTHGAPIQLNAQRQGITPEELIARYYEEHQQDFRDFFIHFDDYYSTNSSENKAFSDRIFLALKERGDIYTKDIPLTYCENCQRFLPDRFVRGTCPKCGAPDQYGDICEACNASYEPTELLDPQCAMCGAPPGLRTSKHYFFKLSNYRHKLVQWLNHMENIQEEIKNYCFQWLKEGLRDWDISRDAPYFGFPIVGEKDKYYYVWLDAPIGYIAATKHYCDQHNHAFEDYWLSPDGEIIHFIGKDIIYFHFLFWPAMLMGSGFNLPKQIWVHGFLTIKGEKMSKSRGTYITAREYLEKLHPEYLRYYYAAHLTQRLSDIDIQEERFCNLVNSHLLGNLLNLAHRTLQFCKKKLEGKVLPFTPLPQEETIQTTIKTILEAYQNINFATVEQKLQVLGDLGNRTMQSREPWRLVKENPREAHQVISQLVDLTRRIAILLAPILPETAKNIFHQLALPEQTIQELDHPLGEHTIGTPSPLLPRLQSFPL